MTTTARDDVIRTDIGKVGEIERWLERLGYPAQRDSRGVIVADLHDLHASATKYPALLDALLALPPEPSEEAANRVADITSELRHMAWHIRSVARRLDRLAVALDPEDE